MKKAGNSFHPLNQVQLKIALISCFILLPLSQALSQPFGQENTLCSGQLYEPIRIVSEDINQDDIPDIIVSSYSHRIDWYPGLGNCNFARQEILLDGYEYPFFYISDYDGDSITDLAFCSVSGNMICWCKNPGNALFDSVTIIDDEIYHPDFLQSGDFDFDGDTDLLVSYNTNNDQSVFYLNNGEGEFSTQPVLSSSQSGPVIDTRDMDNDSDIDLVMYDGDSLNWLENEGQWTYNEQHFLAVVGGYNWAYAFSDLDNDGDDDLMYSSQDTEVLGWLENIGGFSFGFFHHVKDIYPVNTISAGDLDNDGDIDVLVGADPGFGILLFENDGNGLFHEEPQIYKPGKFKGFSIDDLDLDGDLDFAEMQTSRTQIAWFENKNSLSFSGPNLLTTTILSPQSAVGTDFDADGDMDILSASSGEQIVAGFFNTGYHMYDEMAVIKDSIADPYWGAGLMPCDFDKDNDTDLLLTSYGSYILVNDGSGNLDSVIILPSSWETEEGHLEDLDNDGNQDILLALYDGVQWYKNLGDGNFSLKALFDYLHEYGNTVTTADVDEDGDAEVVYSCPYYNPLKYVMNEGQGNFSDPIWFAQSSADVVGTEAADIDGDGDPDIIVAMRDKIAWYENQDGSFNNVEHIIILVHPNSPDSRICLTDFYLDGKIDLVYTDQDKLFWCENLGGAVFDEPVMIGQEIQFPTSISAIDLDYDGDNDILLSSSSDGKVAWFENLFIVNSVRNLANRNDEIKIYPSPASEIINIKSSSQDIVHVKLMDISGKNLTGFDYPHGDGEVRLDISDKPCGIYILLVTLKDGFSLSKKLVKVP